MVKCTLTFTGVSIFNIKPDTLVDYDEILEVEILDKKETIKIVLNSEDDVKILIVKAKMVNLIKSV